MIVREGFSEVRAALAHMRAAMFILATLLLALSGIGLASFPRELHSVPLHLDEQRLRQLSLAGSPTHRLEVGRDGRMAFDGKPSRDLLDLRQHLDLIRAGREPILDVLPDPQLSYERLVEIVAVAGRAAVNNIRLDLQPSAGIVPTRGPSPECRERYVL
jgi:biopolymer transport protein ExbD